MLYGKAKYLMRTSDNIEAARADNLGELGDVEEEGKATHQVHDDDPGKKYQNLQGLKIKLLPALRSFNLFAQIILKDCYLIRVDTFIKDPVNCGDESVNDERNKVDQPQCQVLILNVYIVQSGAGQRRV